MKNLYLLWLLLVVSGTIVAQDMEQKQLYLSYPLNSLAINPAYAGSREINSATGIFRKRSLVVQGLPSSQYFSMDFPIANAKWGMGIQAFSASSSLGSGGAYLSFAKRIYLHNGTLSFGSQVGFTQIQSYTAGAVAVFKPNIGFGIYYRNSNAYIGVAMPSFLKNTYQTSTSGSITTEYSFARPIFVTGGYVFHLQDKLDFKASILAQQKVGLNNTENILLDYQGNLWYKQKYGIGFGYLNTGSEFNSKALIASAEVQVNNKIRLGYSYDFGINYSTAIQNPLTGNAINSEGMHLLMLRYEWGNPDILSSFRFF